MGTLTKSEDISAQVHLANKEESLIGEFVPEVNNAAAEDESELETLEYGSPESIAQEISNAALNRSLSPNSFVVAKYPNTMLNAEVAEFVPGEAYRGSTATIETQNVEMNY